MGVSIPINDIQRGTPECDFYGKSRSIRVSS
jgi:hypothetical protein